MYIYICVCICMYVKIKKKYIYIKKDKNKILLYLPYTNSNPSLPSTSPSYLKQSHNETPLFLAIFSGPASDIDSYDQRSPTILHKSS